MGVGPTVFRNSKFCAKQKGNNLAPSVLGPPFFFSVLNPFLNPILIQSCQNYELFDANIYHFLALIFSTLGPHSEFIVNAKSEIKYFLNQKNQPIFLLSW